MAAQPGLLSSQMENPGAHKMSQPSQVQGEAVVTPVQTRPGLTAAWMCRDAFVPGQHQRRAETDGRSPQQGGTRAGLQWEWGRAGASNQSQNEPQEVGRRHWELEAEGWGQLPSSDKLAGADLSLPAFLQGGFPNQSIKKPSMELVAINKKAPSSVGNNCGRPASLRL